VHAVRRDFPILSKRVNGRQLVWLDNAATTQKPQSVIDRLTEFYENENSNIHRAAHTLAARATDAYEKARATVARFVGAGSADEIVFVRGATEGINLIAQSWGRQNVHDGDEIVISHLDHHANIVPWQRLVAETGAALRVIPVDSDGQILLDEYQRLLSDRTKLVAVAHVSNALGTVVPVRDVIDLAHRAGACALIDGAQSVSHLPVDVRGLDADFFVFSGHKVFGPTGIGAVYAKAAILDAMPPWQTGGNMISDVTLERSTFEDPPMRFEAGTGNIADAVGLGEALEYLERLGIDNVARYEHALLGYATERMLEVPGLRLIGTAPEKASVLSFVLDGYTTEQVGQALSSEGVAVRAGHHCAQPILRRFGLETTVRPSLALYNTEEDVDALVGTLHRLTAPAGRGGRWPRSPPACAGVGCGPRSWRRRAPGSPRSVVDPDDRHHQAGQHHRSQDPPPGVHPAHDLIDGPPGQREGLGKPQGGAQPAVADHQGADRRDDEDGEGGVGELADGDRPRPAVPEDPVDGATARHRGAQRTSRRSTTKSSVSLGPIAPPAPRAP
jgi:cysteine desulfurase/selenocysteine lyase